MPQFHPYMLPHPFEPMHPMQMYKPAAAFPQDSMTPPFMACVYPIVAPSLHRGSVTGNRVLVIWPHS